ncbi:MAG: zinc ABC transporter substrate-binding protein [Magnetococcus sp. DMHC-1]
MSPGFVLLCGLIWTFLTSSVLAATSAADGLVVVTIKPVHSLVAGIMEGFATPTLLLNGAASPHTYTLRPSDARALEKSRLIVRVGRGLELFLERPLASLASRSRVVAMLELSDLHRLPSRQGGVWDASHGHVDEPRDAKVDHQQDNGHRAARSDHGHDHDPHAGHDPATLVDPHVWLDPENGRVLVAALVHILGDVWPEQKNLFVRNGQRVQERLQALDLQLRNLLLPVRDRPFIVFHDAYHYFEARYGLAGVGTITLRPEHPPGARRIQELHQRLRHAKVVCLFSEPQFQPGMIQGLFKDFDVRLGVLDPLGSALQPGPDAYFQMLENLAADLRQCLAGN